MGRSVFVFAAFCVMVCAGGVSAIVLSPTRPTHVLGNGTPKSDAQLTAAFKQDGYDVAAIHRLSSGQRGIMARSTNVTLLSTGQPKVVYYFEGSGYQMGFLHGYMLENSTSIMATDYLDHFIPSMISWKFDKKASASPKYAKLYDFVTSLIGDFLMDKSVKSFNNELAGTFPEPLLQEMQGIVDGAKAANPATVVSMDRLITLNYGMDFLSTQVFGGGLLGHLKDYIRTAKGGKLLQEADDDMVELLELLEADFFTVPAFCDAFVATGDSHVPSSGPVYARSFQLPTAGYFQDYQTMFIYMPSDGRVPAVSAAAPGLVGSITAMNAGGLVLGVDTLRSGLVNLEHPGINSCLLIRATIQNVTTVDAATDYIASLKRGCSYLYHMLDTSENAAIIEAARYNASNSIPSTATLIKNDKLRAALPTDAFMAANSHPDYRTGIFVRHLNYSVPSAFHGFNEGLFELAGVPYAASDFSNATGQVFPSWETEDADWFKIGSRYFSPVRMPYDDVALVTNFALTPQLRVAQMTFWASLFPGDSMQWRYDTINRMLVENYGNIDHNVARDIITFLSPDRTPGYWTDTLNASDPMSAIVEGHLVVADVKNGIFQVKGGYWSDKWLQVQLPNYV